MKHPLKLLTNCSEMAMPSRSSWRLSDDLGAQLTAVVVKRALPTVCASLDHLFSFSSGTQQTNVGAATAVSHYQHPF